MTEYYKVFNKLSRVYEHVARIALVDGKYAIGVWNNKYIVDVIAYNIDNHTFDYYGSRETHAVLLDLNPGIIIGEVCFGKYIYLQNKELKAFIENNSSRFVEDEKEKYIHLRKIGRGFIRITFEQEKSFAIKSKGGFLFVAKGDCQTFEKRKKRDAKFYERMMMFNQLASKGYDNEEILKDFFELKILFENVFKDGDVNDKHE